MSHKCPDCGYGCQSFNEQHIHDCRPSTASGAESQGDYFQEIVENLKADIPWAIDIIRIENSKLDSGEINPLRKPLEFLLTKIKIIIESGALDRPPASTATSQDKLAEKYSVNPDTQITFKAGWDARDEEVERLNHRYREDAVEWGNYHIALKAENKRLREVLNSARAHMEVDLNEKAFEIIDEALS